MLNQNSSTISWEITSSKKKEKNKRFIILVSPIIISIIIVAYFSGYSGYLSNKIEYGNKYALSQIIYIMVAVSIILLLYYFFVSIHLYKSRSFHLDNLGLKVSKGEKSKFYSWDDFECFYIYTTYRGYTPDSQSDVGELFKLQTNTFGNVFYLKKKRNTLSSKFYKKFVVIYSEPDNSNNVSEFLKKYLPQKIMTAITDFGLVLYEFK